MTASDRRPLLAGPMLTVAPVMLGVLVSSIAVVAALGAPLFLPAEIVIFASPLWWAAVPAPQYVVGLLVVGCLLLGAAVAASIGARRGIALAEFFGWFILFVGSELAAVLIPTLLWQLGSPATPQPWHLDPGRGAAHLAIVVLVAVGAGLLIAQRERALRRRRAETDDRVASAGRYSVSDPGVTVSTGSAPAAVSVGAHSVPTVPSELPAASVPPQDGRPTRTVVVPVNPQVRDSLVVHGAKLALSGQMDPQEMAWVAQGVFAHLQFHTARRIPQGQAVGYQFILSNGSLITVTDNIVRGHRSLTFTADRRVQGFTQPISYQQWPKSLPVTDTGWFGWPMDERELGKRLRSLGNAVGLTWHSRTDKRIERFLLLDPLAAPGDGRIDLQAAPQTRP